MAIKKIWNIKIKNKADDSSKMKDSLLYSVLKSRGIEESEYEDFLNPLNISLSSPFIFSDMKKSKERIEKAIQNKELILIWGDFDADGVTSTAILYKTLSALGANFDYIIPDREKMGHGINTKVLLPYIAKKKPKVLITVDCGISNEKEINVIKALGVDTILTDHHKAPENLPKAYAIINPKAPNSLNETLSVAQIKHVSELAGAGVAYKLACALLENTTEDINFEQLKNEILILAATGTIADVVPLLYENRAIAAKGLELVNKGIHKGINLLFKANNKDKITSYDMAFILAPRINAAGRLATAESAFKLLVETDESILKASLKELDNYNKIRQNLCDKIYEEAINLIEKDKDFRNKKAIILFNEDWHIGVIGIVASKLVDKYYKPAFLITKDDDNKARCSIRGIKEYNIAEILDENKELFTEGYGGHTLAGGFSFDLEKVSFKDVQDALLNTFNSKEDIKPKGVVLDIDMVLEPSNINTDLTDLIQKLEPTGQDNHPPIFCINDISLVSKKTMGKEGNHLSFKGIKDNKELSCIWWRHNDIPITAGEKFDLAFEPKINSYNGEESIRLYTVDLKCENINTTGHEIKFYDHRQKRGILTQIEEYVKRPGVDIDIYAAKIKTKTLLKNYPALSSKISDTYTQTDIMFFDYPANLEEFVQILQQKAEAGICKVHLMKEEVDYNIENYIKQLIGILKYATNNKNGEIPIKSLAQMIGVSESFIQQVFDMLESLNSIEILDIDRIKFLAPPSMEHFYKHLEFEALDEEFKKIIEFKKYIAQATLSDIENLLKMFD